LWSVQSAHVALYGDREELDWAGEDSESDQDDKALELAAENRDEASEEVHRVDTETVNTPGRELAMEVYDTVEVSASGDPPVQALGVTLILHQDDS